MSDRLISADALRQRMYHDAFETDTEMQRWDGGCWIRYKMFENALEDAPTVDAEPVVWIPITARPIDEEERLKWAEEVGLILENDEALIYTSQLPDDGQEVLVCGRSGRVWIDTFYNDPDYGCYFEENGDMDGIVAWMPLPKPYRERRKEDGQAEEV